MIDLNCDLGENEPPARTLALLCRVTSANIACGGHAGNERTMRRCLRWCRELGVRAGAHPGWEGNFGRTVRPITPRGLADLLERQWGTLDEIARSEGVSLTHLKLHGALYHAVEADAALARACVGFVRRRMPGAEIYAWSGGRVLRAAARAGVPARGELFADRAYAPDGTLAPRGRAGAVLHDPREVRARITHFLATGRIFALGGAEIFVDAGTICVHADTPGAVKLAQAVSELLSVRRPRRR